MDSTEWLFCGIVGGMKRVYRQLLFFLATVAFLVAAPLVILYAVGYRTSLNADPLPVGVVLVETVPRRAVVYVDDRRVGTTPRALPNLPAGPVQIRIELAGYAPWEKTLSVAPGRAVEARDIRLFPESPQVRTIVADAHSFALSPSRQLLAVSDSDAQVQIVDLVGAPVSQALPSDDDPAALLWSQ